MRLYSAMINADCALVPDMLARVKFALKDVVSALCSAGAAVEAAFEGMFVLDAAGSRSWILDTATQGDNPETPRLIRLLRSGVQWGSIPGLVDKVRVAGLACART